MSEFVSHGSHGAVTWQKNGFGRQGEDFLADVIKSGAIAGANAADRAGKDHIPHRRNGGFQPADFIHRPARGVTGDAVSRDVEAPHLESLTIFDRFASGKGFGFGSKTHRFRALDDPVEFQDVISVGMGEKNLGQCQFMAFESGKKRIGVGASIECYRKPSLGIPNEIVIHRQIGEWGGELKDVGRKGDGGSVPSAIGEGYDGIGAES